MDLQRVAVEEIDEETLRRLVSEGVSEKKTLDFKEELPGGSDGDRKNFCAEVSALANTAGGHLIYGIEDEEGEASALSPINIDNPDEAVRRLESMVQDGIEPRIQGLQTKAIEIDGEGFAFVLDIPRSWVAPHMSTMKGMRRFYGRNSKGKYPLDVDELRARFIEAESISEGIRDFRTKRMGKLLSGEAPVPLKKPGFALLHVVPFESIRAGEPKDLSPLSANPRDFPPLGVNMGHNNRWNLDGFLTYDPTSGDSRGYTLAFREGMIEGGTGGIIDDRGNDRSLELGVHQRLFDGVENYLSALNRVGSEPPVAVLITLGGMEDVVLDQKGRHSSGRRAFDRDVLPLPEIIIEDLDSVDLQEALMPIFDALWQAAGWSECYLYSGNET